MDVNRRLVCKIALQSANTDHCNEVVILCLIKPDRMVGIKQALGRTANISSCTLRITITNNMMEGEGGEKRGGGGGCGGRRRRKRKKIVLILILVCGFR